jgi:hypothetical protein
MHRTPASVAGILLLVTACGDGTGPRIPADLSGVWTTVVPFLDQLDTVRLLLPDASDSVSMAFAHPGGVGAFGVLQRAAGHVSGTLYYSASAGFTIDLVRFRTRLSGTMARPALSDTVRQVSFDRYAPGGPTVAGVWVTSSVVGGSSGTVFLDTLIINRDGRVPVGVIAIGRRDRGMQSQWLARRVPLSGWPTDSRVCLVLTVFQPMSADAADRYAHSRAEHSETNTPYQHW